MDLPPTIDAVKKMLNDQGYVCGHALGTVVFLALKLGRPLFLEGEAGVGKAEIAKALAAGLDRKLIRLQCYEGLDAGSAVYEWNFAAQMVAIRTAEASGGADRKALQTELFSDDYLVERPLLEAMRPDGRGAPILLIDELDRTDEPFEAYLLEALSDFQVTIPELGTIKAPEPPNLSREVVAFVQALRTEDLFKKPGVAETIDWAKCLLALDVINLSPEVIADTLGAILKYQDDIQKLQGSEAKRILDQATATLAAG